MIVVYMAMGGCANTKYYTPRPDETNYYLDGLSANIMEVIVNDRRPNPDHDNGLANVLKMQLWSALYPQPSNQLTNKYVLIVDIMDHHSFFTLGNWNASTLFRIRLVDSMGKMLDQWEGKRISADFKHVELWRSRGGFSRFI